MLRPEFDKALKNRLPSMNGSVGMGEISAKLLTSQVIKVSIEYLN